MGSGPGRPNFGAVAHSGLLPVSDDWSAEQGGILEQLVQLGLVRGQILEQHGVRMLILEIVWQKR